MVMATVTGEMDVIKTEEHEIAIEGVWSGHGPERAVAA